MIKQNYEDMFPSTSSWLLPRENGMLLSDYQIEVLQKNNIDYKKYNIIKELLYVINEMDISEDSELEQVAKTLDEMDYYNK